MKAKDMVMNDEERARVVMGRVRPAKISDHNPRVISHNVEDALLEAQAEISFRAGKDEGRFEVWSIIVASRQGELKEWGIK